MLKFVLKRNFSPFVVLLLLTLIFGMITFIIQTFLHDLNTPLTKMSIVNDIDSHETRYLNMSLKQDAFLQIEAFFRKTEYDYDKCKRLIRSQVELKDLRRIKSSYSNELKQLESKRKNLIKSIAHIQSQIDQLNNQFTDLKQKHSIMQHKILSDLFKSENLKNQIKNEVDQIQIGKMRLETNDTKFLTINSTNECSIDSCFNYNNCKYLNVYIFNPNKILKIVEDVDMVKIEPYFNIVSNLDQACLVVIFLPGLDIEPNNTGFSYYNYLSQFLVNNSDQNFVFIHYQNGYNLDGFKSYLISLNSNWTKSFEDIFNRSFLSSYLYEAQNSNTNFFIHFSIVFDQFSNLTSNENFNKERNYLLTHETLTNNPVFDLLKSLTHKNPKVLSLESSVNIDEQLKLICESKFTLIYVKDSSHIRWSYETNLRLIQALKCSTIPVILQQDLKLPLDHLIAWDEVIIRVPLVKLNSLMYILNNFDEEEIIGRKIKSKNIFTSYFSDPGSMLITILTVIRQNLGLEPILVNGFKTNEISKALRSSRSEVKNEKHAGSLYGSVGNSENDLINYLENDDEDDDDLDIEYLGPINQKPLKTENLNLNYTQKAYTLWNKIYFPFGVFPSNPFDIYPITQNKFSQFLNSSNLDDLIQVNDYLSLTNYSIGGGDGKIFNHLLNGNFKEEQFTIVLLSYKREKILINLLDKYVKLPYLNQIIIVWNSIDLKPSSEFRIKFNLYLSTKRIRLVQMAKNSLNNRFLPFDLIETDAVLSLDDDMNLRTDEIILGFRVWRENRDRIVGFPARYHAWNITEQKFIYQSYLTCEYSMVLTGAAFYHRFYNYYYTYLMEPKIRDKVDELKNCEDIGFNMMVTHLTRKPPIKVTTKWNFYCSECENLGQEESISLKLDHYKERSFCVDYFTQLYSYNPLLYSQYRADSVLFKTRVPIDKQKCFKNV